MDFYNSLLDLTNSIGSICDWTALLILGGLAIRLRRTSYIKHVAWMLSFVFAELIPEIQAVWLHIRFIYGINQPVVSYWMNITLMLLRDILIVFGSMCLWQIVVSTERTKEALTANSGIPRDEEVWPPPPQQPSL